MQKKLLIPGIIIVLVSVTWYLTKSDASDSIELFATPTVGQFVVDVTTTGVPKDILVPETVPTTAVF